jgi:threonine dehydratase
MLSLADIREAHDRIADQVIRTPFQFSKTLSDITGAKVWLKFENLQFTASFKERGAANHLMTLAPESAQHGVIAVSAGNHAQGVAYHCQRLGIPATIVMPRFTPFVKVENTRRFGARVILEGDDLASAQQHMLTLARQEKLSVVPPYDDEKIIAGQGTIGLEMLQAQPSLDTLIISVGGGGLLSGIATAARALKPSIQIVGVQVRQFPGAYQRWTATHGRDDVTTDDPQPASGRGSPTLAEGIAVRGPGNITGPLIDKLADHMTLVDEAGIERAILLLLEIEKTVVEGAGAAGLAALLAEPARYRDKQVGLVLCGGNIDLLTLANITRRQLARADKLAQLWIDAPDSPGSLADIAAIVGAQGANIEEVSHNRAFVDISVRYVRIELTISTRGSDHLDAVLSALNSVGFATRLASDRPAGTD